MGIAITVGGSSVRRKITALSANLAVIFNNYNVDEPSIGNPFYIVILPSVYFYVNEIICQIYIDRNIGKVKCLRARAWEVYHE